MATSYDDTFWTVTTDGSASFPSGVTHNPVGDNDAAGRPIIHIAANFFTSAPLVFTVTQDAGNTSTQLHDDFYLTIQNSSGSRWAGFRIDYVDFVPPASSTDVHPLFAHFHDATNGAWINPSVTPFLSVVGYNTTINSLQPPPPGQTGVNGANELRLSSGIFKSGTQQVFTGINAHQFTSGASGGGSFSVVLTPIVASPTPVAGSVAIAATGDLDSNGRPDFVWSDSSAFMWRWEYDPVAQAVTSTGLGVQAGWTVLGGSHWSNASTDQMLMDYVPNGTMTLWWINNGQLTGINLGQRWTDVAYVGAGQFTANGGTNLLVTNIHDHHLYDWWVNSNNTLDGIDLTNTAGPAWNNVGIVATGQFTANGGTNFLVQNGLDHHLYDWWIGSNSVLAGIDLGPVWSNVALVGTGQFTANGGTNFLVTNTLDHHVYDWWIAANGTLAGIDLGAYWSNVQLVTVGHFDNRTSNTELLVQNTVDHHLYEWWITPQGQLTGIDLGPNWINVQAIGAPQHYNNNSPYDQLLIHNTSDGNFYQWWISNNTLTGVNLGPSFSATAFGASSAAGSTTPGSTPSAGPTVSSPAVDTSLSTTPDSTSLLVQAMASFGTNGLLYNSSGAPLGTDPSQQSPLAAPVDQHLAHG